MNCEIKINEKEKTIKFSFVLNWKHFDREDVERFNHAVAKREWKKLGAPFGLGRQLSGGSFDNQNKDELRGFLLYELIIPENDKKLQKVRKKLLNCLEKRESNLSEDSDKI